MTLTVTIHNPAGTQYAAVVKQEGKPDATLQPGTASEFTIYEGAAITSITETAAEVKEEQAAEGEQASDAGEQSKAEGDEAAYDDNVQQDKGE